MYETFYGLRERPFDLTPNPRFLVLTPGHRRALISLEIGIASRKGIVALVAEPGTGKTTVARALMARRDATTTYVYLNQALSSPADLRRCLVRTFGLGPRADTANTDLVFELTHRLSNLRERGGTAALIVDEAQTLSDEVLEEIRLLTNVETMDGKLLTLVLIGQPKLAARLNEDMWKQLKQRIEIRCELAPLELTETAAYIWSRVRTAGGDAARLFTADAVRLIHERSQGIARSISVIGENALIAGFADSEMPVTRRAVLQVCEELDMRESAPAPVVVRPSVSAQTAASAGPADAHGARLLPHDRQHGEWDRPADDSAAGRRRWSFSGAWLRS